MLDLQLCMRHPVPSLGGVSHFLRDRQFITVMARGCRLPSRSAGRERIQNTGLFGGAGLSLAAH